jgi:TolB-like protein
VANRLSQVGFAVKDLNYVGALTVGPTGELVLSREFNSVSREQHAAAVVAGTYTVGGDEIYLNLRLLRADDGKILSSVDSVLPLDRNVSALVRGY